MRCFWVVLFSLFITSFGMALAVPSPECVIDADCDDGLFCTGTETCNRGICGAVSACPPSVEVCVVRNAICDEKNDTCLDEPDDSFCPQDYLCTVQDTCAADVGAAGCSDAQMDAQNGVMSGGPYKNHGRMVRTAARIVSDYEEAGMITEDCSSCIVSQFARRVPVADQEPCGMLCPFDIRGLFPTSADVTEAEFVCFVPGAAVAVVTLEVSGGEAAGIVFNSTLTVTNVGTGPGLAYQVNDDDLAGIQMTAEEMSACDQELRAYAQELENQGKLGGDDLVSCPPVEEPEP